MLLFYLSVVLSESPQPIDAIPSLLTSVQTSSSRAANRGVRSLIRPLPLFFLRGTLWGVSKICIDLFSFYTVRLFRPAAANQFRFSCRRPFFLQHGDAIKVITSSFSFSVITSIGRLFRLCTTLCSFQFVPFGHVRQSPFLFGDVPRECSLFLLQTLPTLWYSSSISIFVCKDCSERWSPFRGIPSHSFPTPQPVLLFVFAFRPPLSLCLPALSLLKPPFVEWAPSLFH